MIEITILKTRHGTLEDAKKLLPWITKSDAWGVEAFGFAGENAEKEEDSFHEWYNHSRSQFLEMARDVYKKSLCGMGEYNIKLWDYLFRNKKPIYILERLPSSVTKNLKKNMVEYLILGDIAQNKLKERKIEDFLENLRLSLVGFESMRDLRDIEIGKNLDNAEEYLRRKHPFLRELKTINLSVSVGAMHHPENFMKSPCMVEQMAEYSIPNEVMLGIHEKYMQTGNIPNRDVLAYGIALAQISGRFEDFSREDILTLSFEELERRVIS